MPTSAALSKSKATRGSQVKASAAATPVKPKAKPTPKVATRKAGGRKPGAKRWVCSEYQRLFRRVADTCPRVGSDWVQLAEDHSAEQETERTQKACQDRYGFVLKVQKPTGGSEPHPLCPLAHAVNDHVNTVHGTITLNDNPDRLVAELKASINDAFDIAASKLAGLEDTVPDFNKEFKPLVQATEGESEEGESEEDGEDGGEGEEDDEDVLRGNENQDEDIEEFGPGEVPDGVQVLEAIYQPPSPEPAPEAHESPLWDIEHDEQPPAESLSSTTPARPRPKMVSPNKSQPTLFQHFVPTPSAMRATAGPAIPANASNPTTPATPASFPLSKTTGVGLSKAGAGLVAAAKVKAGGSLVASGSKPSTSSRAAKSPAAKKPADSTSKKRKLDESNNDEQLEYVVPKHPVGGKPAAKGTKRASNATKTNDPSAKKSNGKEREEVLDISSDEGTPRRDKEFIDKFIQKKEASNVATVAVMDSKRELHMVREQLAAAQKTIEELREQIRDYEVEKRVQERLREMGAVAPAPPPTIDDVQFRKLLEEYLLRNNLSLIEQWDGASFNDPIHPFAQPHPANNNFEPVP